MFPACARFHQRHPRLFLFLIAVWFFAGASTIHAQSGASDPTGTGGRHSIKGRLVFPSGQRADIRLKVRLESFGSGDLMVISDVNGNFGFQSLRPGNYTVIIEGGEHFESERETVLVESGTVAGRRTTGVLPINRPFVVQVYLRSKTSATTTKTGVLNAALAAAPKRAADLYHQALASSAKNNHEQAVSELKQALVIYPGFALALNELGVQYLKMGQPQRAVESLRAALKIQPDDFITRLNYGIALIESKRPAEAEVELRMAVNQNDNSWQAHMYLGVSLIALRRLDDAEQELLRALTVGGPRLGLPRYYLGGIYWRRGEYQRAATELEKYLESAPNAPNAERVRGTIKELRARG
ncbi:MAG: tetratricopeptide repeat protein [Acidobacteriota bacterium]